MMYTGTRTKKSSYRCVNCGAALDPGERCDCEQKQKEVQKAKQQTVYNARRGETDYERYMRDWWGC